MTGFLRFSRLLGKGLCLSVIVLGMLPAIRSPRVQADRFQARRKHLLVRRVIDGDTILLLNGKLVRYIGIDAPEIDHCNGVAEAYAFEARRLNCRLIGNGGVFLEQDHQRHDRYGRLLAYVYNDEGLMINASLLQAGLAYLFPHRCNLRYYKLLLGRQQEAMDAKKGIWKFWSEPTGITYIGNLKSGRFHLPGCPMGKRVAPANRCMLRSAWDAFYRGLSPCRLCQPPMAVCKQQGRPGSRNMPRPPPVHSGKAGRPCIPNGNSK